MRRSHYIWLPVSLIAGKGNKMNAKLHEIALMSGLPDSVLDTVFAASALYVEQVGHADDRDRWQPPVRGKDKHASKQASKSERKLSVRQEKTKDWRHRGGTHCRCDYCVNPYKRSSRHHERECHEKYIITSVDDAMSQIDYIAARMRHKIFGSEMPEYMCAESKPARSVSEHGQRELDDLAWHMEIKRAKEIAAPYRERIMDNMMMLRCVHSRKIEVELVTD